MARAKKKVKVSKKSAASTHAYRHRHEQSQFMIIVAGGFLLIVLISLSFGLYHTPRVRQMVQNTMDTMKKETVITIQNNMFTSPVTVKAGTKVTWINNDSVAHNVIANDGSFDLGTVTKDQTKSYVFTKPGTYTYHCSFHPGMEGTVIVE